jgi:hypothetical protein
LVIRYRGLKRTTGALKMINDSTVNKLGESMGNRGKGRKKGSQNKNTQEIKSMIMAALDKVGGEAYFVNQAIENPVAFLGLIGKILPKEIAAELNGNMNISSITRTIIDPKFSADV